MINCKICGRKFKKIGAHLKYKHSMTGEEYHKMFPDSILVPKKYLLFGDKNPSKRPDVRRKISEAKKGHATTKKTRGKISRTLKEKHLKGLFSPPGPSEEALKRSAERLKKNPPILGLSEERRKEVYRKRSENTVWRKNISRAMVKLWKDESFANKQTKLMSEGRWNRPTKLEEKIIQLISEYELPYDYVGDGKVFIARKVPDFIDNNGEKKLIEVAGDYWHTPKEMEERAQFFAKYGYKTLVIWEHDINLLEGFEIAERIRSF